jgi:hypothetical protein
MSKALFFNALPDTVSSTGYDRNYNADDLSDFLSIVCDTGVVKTNTVEAKPQGLRVVEASGMIINVNAGKAVINGKALMSDAIESFTITANGTASNRYDYVVIKYDNNVSVRNITLELRTGTNTIPTVANLTRNAKVYELMLAYISVAPSATIITQTNITDTRGDAELCPWFTAVKGYDEYYDAIIQKHENTVTLSSITNIVITDLPSTLYNERYSLIEVYTNGIKEPKEVNGETVYNVSVIGGVIVITFTAQKAVGSKITVILNNFIDGEGLTTVLAQYTELVKTVATLQTAGGGNYICNGVNDNVVISELVKSRLSDSGEQGAVKLNIIGNIGFAAPVSGTGTTINPYAWFNFDVSASRKVILDFTQAKILTPAVTNGTTNIIFKTAINLTVIGASVVVINNTPDTTVKAFDGEKVTAENCSFVIDTYKDSHIATRGTFNNCRGEITNTINNSFCFDNKGVLRINGGTYYAYCGSGYISAIMGQTIDYTVCLMYGVDAPTATKSGYAQNYSIYATGGQIDCTALMSRLAVRKQYGEIRNTINDNVYMP